MVPRHFVISLIPLAWIILALPQVCSDVAQGIKCYQCLPKVAPASANQTGFSEPCSLFDSSSKFVVDCPLSTFCMKRNFTLEFPDGRSAVVTERGCAQQSFSYRILKGGQWKTVNDVNETVYQDGCISENQGNKPPTLYCYCSSRLCNLSSKLTHTTWALSVGTLLSSLTYAFYTFSL